MTRKIAEGHPLRRLFQGLVEQAFMSELGVCDVQITDYLSAMLCDFVHVDDIFRLRTVDGHVIREVSQAEAAAYLGPEVDGTLRTRIVNRYIGDFTLFWTGVYPESLRARTAGVDRLNEYLLQGRRSYGIASELSTPDADPPASLLRRLSDEFEHCVCGLHLVRESWRQMSHDAGDN